VQTGQFAESGLFKLDIEALALVHLDSSVCSHFDNTFLAHLLNRLVELLVLVGNARYFANAAVVGHEFLSKAVVPDA